MAFAGWAAEVLEFYEGLAADNTKSYWSASKDFYEDQVRRPMTELLAELEPEFGGSKIFRPYRDVRFSKDKSPYQTHIGAVVGDGYLQLSANGLAAGAGMYQMAPDQLDRYRQAVAADTTGVGLESVISKLGQHGIGVTGHDSLKTVPRGYPADHPRTGLLRYKGIIAWHEWPVEPWLGTPAAKDRIQDFLVATRPLNAWLESTVGPSTLDRPGR